MDKTEFFFKLPNSMLRVKVTFNVRVWECWVEDDYSFSFGGEYLSFEEAIERCMELAK